MVLSFFVQHPVPVGDLPRQLLAHDRRMVVVAVKKADDALSGKSLFQSFLQLRHAFFLRFDDERIDLCSLRFIAIIALERLLEFTQRFLESGILSCIEK